MATERQRLERAAEHYLLICYRKRTAARVSEFAAVLRITQPYLSGIVRDVFGIPAREFLRRRQLGYATGLLRSTQATVAEIAVLSAFGTESTFSRCFARAFGTTPGRYRHLMKCGSTDTPPPSRAALHPERRLEFD